MINKEFQINDAKIKFRIFCDSKEKNIPLLVNFHGGGWVLGDLDADDDILSLMNDLYLKFLVKII